MVEVSHIASSAVTPEDCPHPRKKNRLPVLLERPITWAQRNPVMGALLLVVLCFIICAVAVSFTYNQDARLMTDQALYDSNEVSSPLVFTGSRCLN